MPEKATICALPFLVFPGVEEGGVKYITSAGYIKGSFIFVETKKELEAILDGIDLEESEAGYSIQDGTPIYVASEGKMYVHKGDKSTQFDFLRDDLTPGNLYLWKDNSWYDVTDTWNLIASQEGIEKLREEINTKIDDIYKSLSQETTERENAITALETALSNNRDELETLISKLQESLDKEILRAKEAEQLLSDKVGDLDSLNTTEKNNLVEAINSEIERATDAEEILQQNIDAEQTRAQAAEKTNSDAITAEQSRAEGAEDALGNRIDAEAATRQEEDESLQSAIDTEVARAKAAEADLQSNLNAEISRATTAEQTNSTAIEAEKSRAIAREDEINNALTTETSERNAEDTALGKRIDDLTSTVNTNKTDLQSAIDAEATRAKAAEKANTDAIEAEESRATTVEQVNAKAITDEAARAEAAEKVNADAITAEESRATAAEETNASNITKEELRATTAEQANTKAIEAEVTRAKAAEESNASAIETEKNRAMAAEAVNANNITTEQARATGAETALASKISAIEEKIPTEASKENQLADKKFVNSSIAANAARFITPSAGGNSQFSSFESLQSGPYFYEGQSLTSDQLTNNDYAIFLKDVNGPEEEGGEEQWRALYQKSGEGPGSWAEQYKIGSAFTSAQQQAIDSGITEELVGQITTNKNDIVNIKAQDSVQDTNIGNLQNTISEIQTNLTGEIARATNEENDLQTAISNEETRATGVENSLQTNIEALQQKDTEQDTAINNEETRATKAEEELKTKIDNMLVDLDVPDEAKSGFYVSSVSQKDGKISVTRDVLPSATATLIDGRSPIKVEKDDSGITISHEGKQAPIDEIDNPTTLVSNIETDTTGHVTKITTASIENLTIKCGTAKNLA